jgi:hypothetical protein
MAIKDKTTDELIDLMKRDYADRYMESDDVALELASRLEAFREAARELGDDVLNTLPCGR